MTFSKAGPATPATHLLRAALLACAGAAALHLGAAPSHLVEYRPAGAFMITAGISQLAWVFWMMNAPSRVGLVAGLAGNGSIVALWIVSRTAGLPFGPMPWTPEDIHSADLLTTLLEVLVVVAAIGLRYPELPRSPRRLVGAAGIGTFLTVFASAHDPLQERAVAFAVLGFCAIATGFAAAGPYSIEVRPFWRTHVKAAFAATRSVALRLSHAPSSSAR